MMTHTKNESKYLLIAESEVRTASYGLSFFISFYGPSAKRASHENKEGKTKIHNLPYEANKTFSVWLC